jgi:hypothetical protein
MRKATSRTGARVVLKTIVDSNERRLLQYLSGIKAPLNHTIPLLDVIDLSIGKTIIALPQKAPLDEVLRFVTVLTTLSPFVFNSLKGWPLCISTRLRTVTSNPGM